jgi:hypothetical protein
MRMFLGRSGLPHRRVDFPGVSKAGVHKLELPWLGVPSLPQGGEGVGDREWGREGTPCGLSELSFCPCKMGALFNHFFGLKIRGSWVARIPSSDLGVRPWGQPPTSCSRSKPVTWLPTVLCCSHLCCPCEQEGSSLPIGPTLAR